MGPQALQQVKLIFLLRETYPFLPRTNRKEDTTMTITSTPIDPLLDIKAVAEALSRSRASIYRDIKAETFPKPLKICGSARWRTSQVRDFIEGLRPDEG